MKRSSVACGEECYISPALKRTKVQAQRKFAQGSNNYPYSATKIVSKTSENIFPSFQSSQQMSSPDNEEYELNNFSRLPSVDDFLTFLCFRETDVLPERLNYLNTPQFDVFSIKKKQSKLTATTLSVNATNSDQNRKLKQSKNDLKNKKQGEYKLRSRSVSGKGVVTKTSCSLAIKHNQRLRSKSVVQAKICESKLQNFKKFKPHALTKPIVKNENLTSKSIIKNEIADKFGKHDFSNFQRVTRRNSLLEKPSERISSLPKKVVSKKSVPKKSDTSLEIREISVCLRDSEVDDSKKPRARSLRISLPKVKNAVTKSLVSSRASLKPTRRSTRSHTVQEDAPFQKINSRPSRKTKEAAALYTEMISKELLRSEDNFEDDDISVESFPELPNIEQHMRREKELKQMNRKKNLEKPVSRRTGHTKTKLFVRPCENCMPSKIASGLSKVTEELSKVEDLDKTLKERVKIAERMKIKKRPKSLELGKNTNDSLKSTQPVKITKEPSKVVNHMQIVKELSRTSKPVETVKKLPEVLEDKKALTKTTTLIRNDEKLLKLSEFVNNVVETSKHTRNEKTLSKSIVCFKKASNIPAKHLKKNTSQLTVHSKKQSYESVEQVEEISAELTEQFRKNSPSFEECCKGVSCKSKNELSKHAKQFTMTTPESAIQLNEKTADLAEQLSKSSARSVEPIRKESSERVEQIMASPCQSTEQVKKESAKQGQAERTSILSKSSELTKKELKKPVEQVKEIFSRFEQQTKNKLNTYAEPFNNESSTSTEQNQKELSRSVEVSENILSKSVEQMKQISLKFEKHFNKETFEYAKLNKKGSLKTKQIVPFRCFEQIEEKLNEHKEQVRQESHESVQQISDVSFEHIELIKKKFSTLDNQAKNESHRFTEETQEELPKIAEKIKGESYKLPEQIEKHSSKLSMQIQKESSESIKQYKKNLSKSTEKIKDNLSKPLKRVKHELLKTIEQHENNISKPTEQIKIKNDFLEFSEQFKENSSKPTERVRKDPSKSIEVVKADSSESKEQVEVDFSKPVAQVEKRTFKSLGQVKKELFKSKEPVKKESLESTEEMFTELPKSVLIRKELSGTSKNEATKLGEKNKSIAPHKFEHWKMKQPGAMSEQSIKRKDLLVNLESKRTADELDKVVDENNALETSPVAVNYSNMSEDLLKTSRLLKVSKEPSKYVAKKDIVDKQIESSVKNKTEESVEKLGEKINLLNEQSTTVEQRKIKLDTEKKSIRNNGLCTRSKQYNSELNNEHSVKIIRTRVRNTNSLERRSSFNDIYDKSKHVNNIIVRESKRKCAKHISFVEYSSVESEYEDSDDDKPIIKMVTPKSTQAVKAVEKKIDKRIQTQQLRSSLKSKAVIKKFKKRDSSLERRKSCSDVVGKVKSLDQNSTSSKNDKLVNSSSLNDFKEMKFVDISVEENPDSPHSSNTKITDSSIMKYENSGLSPNKKIVVSRFETNTVEKIDAVDNCMSSNDTAVQSVSKVITTNDDTDFKRPLQERQFFSRAKTAKNESKPMIQTVISSSSRVFNLESKKISPITLEQKEEVSPKKSEAFSADNENSVYAFEPDLPTTSPPFRRLKPVTPPKSIASNSIAVQVNFENDSKVEYSNSAEAQVSSTTDCIGDRVFYIPIQTSTLSSTLGVAVKLDTDGNSQKIIMSATLITNSPTCTSNTTTAVCSKTSDVGTTCTLTEMMTLSNKEQVMRKSNSTPSAESGKIINSVDDKDEQDPCSSTVSISKNIKNIPIRGNTQSVRILKINKNKKMKKQFNKPERLGYSVSNLKSQPTSSESVISKTKKIHLYPNNSETSLNARKIKSLSIDAEAIEPMSTSVDSELIRPETISVKSFQQSSELEKFETLKTRFPSTNSRIGEPEVVVAEPSFGVETMRYDNVKVDSASVNSQMTVPGSLKTKILSVNLAKNKLKTTNAQSQPASLEITKLEQSKLFQSSYSETEEQQTLKMKTMSVCSDAARLEIPKTKSRLTDSETKKQEALKIKSQIIDSETVKVDITRTKSRPLNSDSLELEAMKAKSRPAKNKSVKSVVQESKSDTEKQLSTPQGKILEAPTFYPSEEEFNDPLEYIDKIRPEAEKFGLCRIVPPSNFRPECKVADEMRFTAYNQYVHKMLHRWGPNVKEMMAIRKFLATQNITFTHPPWIGGMEVDLPHLYQIVQQCGGLKAVIEKERWQMVADIMRIPKLAQDRITKLDDIYCKYLLPYDILSHDEREKLFEEIEKEWMDHLKNPSDDEVFEDIDECIIKGRTMPLSCFYRIARNTMMMCFGNMEGQEGPSTETIEAEFWNHVSKRKSHVCVHCGSIDSGTYGYGFSVAKNSTFRKHPWNLKVLTNNSASILRFLGPVMGVTVPTLHVGMLYSACCWYRDPHGLPWIEYLHTGANKIWYGISNDHSEQFREAMLLLVPRYCKDKKIWLPSDTVMIPPPLLTSHNIPLSRVVQQPGQFIVVFPKAFTSSISTGYLVSESVYFAHASWLNTGKQVFMDMQDSCEPSVFSFEQLLINIAEDTRPSLPILTKVLPLLLDLRETETTLRCQLKKMGLCTFEKLNVNRKRKTKGTLYEEDSYECDTCHTFLFISLVVNSNEQCHYCLKHAVSLLNKQPTQLKHCTLMYAYTEDELDELISKVKARIEAKSSKKSHGK